MSLKSTVAVWVTPCAMKLHVLPEKPVQASPHVVTLLPRTGVAVKLALVPVSIVPTQSAPQRMPGPVTLLWFAALPVLVTTSVVTPENSALVL